MATALHDTVMLTTPNGHEVEAELDYEAFAVKHAKVVHHYTGVVKQLDAETAEVLARALKAKQVYEHALSETRAAQGKVQKFGHLAHALGDDHPALEPYVREAEKHRQIARDMFLQAQNFHDNAMTAIDKLVGE